MNVRKVYDELQGEIDHIKVSGSEAAAIVALRERVSKVEDDVGTLDGQVDAADEAIEALDGRVNDLEEEIGQIVTDATLIKGVAVNTFSPGANNFVIVDTGVVIPSGYEISDVMFTLHRGSGSSYDNIDTVGVSSATGSIVYGLAYGFTASTSHTLTFFELSAGADFDLDRHLNVTITADNSGNTPNLFSDYSGNDYTIKTFYTFKQVLT